MKSITNEEHAAIELKHIQLELSLRHERLQHLRHFVDQYYCYKKGLVNSNGGAKWSEIVWNGNVSVEARKIENRKLVVKEHVVPLKVITDQLRNLAKVGDTDLDSIASVLDKYTLFATITKEEDSRLKNAGLNSKMPDGFTERGHELFDNVFARYDVAKIEMEKTTIT